jgi:hypothetical protein
MQIAPGTQLGVESEIGASMGRMFRARDSRLNRLIVIKIR